MTVTFLGFNKDGGINGSRNAVDSSREYNARYCLRSTSPPTTLGVWAEIYAALSGAGVSLGAACPVDSGAVCVNIRPASVPPKNLASAAGSRRWDVDVDVKYSSNPTAVPQSQDDPSLRPPTIRFYSMKWMSPALKDAEDGRKIQNSARDPITRERRRATLVCKINKVFTNYAAGLAREAPKGLILTRNQGIWSPIPDVYKGTFTGPGNGGNDMELFGILPGRVRLEELMVTSVFENGRNFAHVEAEFWIDDQKFADKLLDQGFAFLGPDDKPRRIMDSGGTYATTPQLLDGNGHALGKNANPVTLSFNYYPLADWNDLLLP